MTGIDEIRAERMAKIKKMKEMGTNPYPVKTNRDTEIIEFTNSFDEIEKLKEEKIIAGRIMSRRGHGALIFLDLFDGTGRVQVVLKEDEAGRESLDFFSEVVDVGDFIEVVATAFITKRGERSALAKKWRILSKSVLPLPKEHFGIKDEDEKFRKRYLDILLNDNVAEMVCKKSKFWNSFRSFLLERGYIEVETPILENTTGGAEAEPFTTHHNALDIDVYLRISPELWHKRLIVAGIPKVFEIGRIFRNEGMSSEHLQDYTQLEFYEAYSDFEKGMKMIIDLYRKVANEVFGTSKFIIKEKEIDFDNDWEVYNFSEIIKEKFNIDPLETSIEEVKSKLREENIDFNESAISVGRGVDLLWKSIRKTYAGPGFLIGIPKYLEPLAKASESDNRIVERFQVILAGSEMGKGFSELNDPLDQRDRFMQQQALRDAGDAEAQMADMAYVEALEYGMPPTFGFGVSERLFSFLMNKNVRETQIFPLMRPKS